MNYIIQNIPKSNLTPSRGIGINIPFNGETGLNITYNTKDSTRANLLNFLLTSRRERILNPNFGSSIRDEIFEQLTQQNLENIQNIIQNGIQLNFPQVNIIELNITPDENSIIIFIKYSINNTNIEDDIQINLNNDR